MNNFYKKLKKYNYSLKFEEISFIPKECNELFNFLGNIKNFGNIYYNLNLKFKKCPKIISDKRRYLIYGDKENILTKTGKNNEWMGTICRNIFIKSIEYEWKIKILKTSDYNIMVGVAPYDFDVNSSDYKYGWYLNCSKLTLNSGPPHNYCNEKSNLKKIKDEILIIMNVNKKSLKFIIDNEDKGESYTNIPIDKPLSPVVLLYNKDDSVEIISNCYSLY